VSAKDIGRTAANGVRPTTPQDRTAWRGVQRSAFKVFFPMAGLAHYNDKAASQVSLHQILCPSQLKPAAWSQDAAFQKRKVARCGIQRGQVMFRAASG
jgi:hypothetical protein